MGNRAEHDGHDLRVTDVAEERTYATMWLIACSGSKAGIVCQILPRPVHLSCQCVASPRGFDINSERLLTRVSTQCGLVDSHVIGSDPAVTVSVASKVSTI